VKRISLFFALCLLLSTAAHAQFLQPGHGGGANSFPACTNGQVFVYNSTSGKWDTCADLSGGGDMLASVYTTTGKLKTSVGGLGADVSAFSGIMHFSTGVPTASSIVNADISASAAIALSKLATIGDQTILGNNSGDAGVPLALSASQTKTLLSLAKADVGLGNVDNTTDANKPVSSATQSALDAKQATITRPVTAPASVTQNKIPKWGTGGSTFDLADGYATGTTSGTLALGDHAHAGVYEPHTANLTTIGTPNAWKVFYSDGSGAISQLTPGAAGTALMSNGATSAPSFQTPSGAGDVLGPATNSDTYLPQWSGTNSKTLANGVAFSTNTSLGTSDATLSSQNAVKTYVDTGLSGKADVNADTTGMAGSIKSPATTGKTTITGPAAASTRAKTVRDADDTILELGGAYTPTGAWNWQSATGTWPTFNQNTTGSAAKWTTARSLAGNSVDGSANATFANKFIVQGTTDAGLSAAQFLGSLGTGIVKNTTTTGVLSIAAAGTDYAPATSGTAILKGNGSGGFSAASAGTDYLAPSGSAAALTSFPTLNQNTTGTAANLSGTPTVPNGTAATTQTQADSSTKLATTAYVDTGLGTKQATLTNPLVAAGTQALTADWDVGNFAITAKSFTAKKVSGQASQELLYSANSTDVTGAGFMGPATAVSPSYFLQLPATQPANGQIMTAGTPSSNISTMTWASPLVNPMTTAGDLIYGGTSGAATRLGVGASGKILASNGTDPGWSAYTVAAPGAVGAVLYSDGTNWTRSAAPTVSAANMTSFPTLNQNTTGTSAGLSAQYLDWNSSSGGTSIANHPTGTSGNLAKWGASNTLTDGPKVGTFTDAKWCSYTTAGGLQCTETAPAGTGDLIHSGTPAIYQWGVFTDSTHIKGVAVTASKVACTDANGEPVACTNLTDVVPLVSGGALGTPSSATLTNATGLPVAGITASTSTALGVGSVELGHASDTTVARVSAGVISVEGVTIPRTIASGSATFNPTSIASAACSSAVDGGTATGVATTDVIDWGFSGDPTAVTGYVPLTAGGVYVIAYPTADHVNLKACNNTAGAIDPGSITINWRVQR
jgi:hypothetical protein